MTSTLVSSALTGLRKSFGNNVVLDGIDLDIAEGTVFSLLGPNGAGKTTTIQIFSTLLHPDGGEVHIGGFDLSRQPGKVRSVIGVTGKFSAVGNLLTGTENLMLLADLHHIERRSARRRVEELLDRFDAGRAGSLTRGQLQHDASDSIMQA
jgi:ABC-2 type transport system ATP-binding protein